MPTIACVTAVTADDVNLGISDGTVRIEIDRLGIYLAGVDVNAQLRTLSVILNKLGSAADAIVAQQVLDLDRQEREAGE